MEHLATALVLLAVGAALVGAVRAMVRRKKAGKHTCSGNCDSCRGCQ